MSAPLRSEISNLQRLPSPFNPEPAPCDWCGKPGALVLTKWGTKRPACSSCAPYVRALPATQPMGNDSPLCAKCDLPVSDRLHADDHMFTHEHDDEGDEAWFPGGAS